MSPWASLHDRACELYQQIIGIDQLKRKAHKEQTCLASIVYGKKHYDEDHREEFYKLRYLRRVIDGKRIMAYPNGIPGGWS